MTTVAITIIFGLFGFQRFGDDLLSGFFAAIRALGNIPGARAQQIIFIFLFDNISRPKFLMTIFTIKLQHFLSV